MILYNYRNIIKLFVFVRSKKNQNLYLCVCYMYIKILNSRFEKKTEMQDARRYFFNIYYYN